MNWFLRPLDLLWRNRRLLFQTTREEIRSRFAGSVMGMAWLVLYPMLFLGVYAGVYVFVFKVRLAHFQSEEYVALIFCGLIPFLGFAEALSSGVTSVTSNAKLIKNTLFPIELVPVKAVLTSQCTQIVGTVLLLAVLGVLGKLTLWALLLPVVWLLQVFFTLGLIWVLSSLNVYLRDLQNVISVVILMLMLGSPIAYTVDMIPSALRKALYLNPLYYIIICYQDCLMMSRFPRGGAFWGLLILGLGGLWFGFWFFSRMKRVFVDNV